MSALLNNKLHHARNLLQNGDSAGTLAICAEILARAPRNAEALTLRGIAALMNGSAAQAAGDFRLALQAAPRDVTVLEYLGLALLNLGEFAEAEQVLQKATALPGAPPSARFRLGMALLHQGRAPDAIITLRQALAQAPGNPDCLLGLGQALAANGDPAGAAAQFAAILQVAPRHPDAQFNLGVLDLANDDLAAARRRFEGVLADHPHHADAMVNLAVVLERSGAAETAMHRLQQALALFPSHPHAHSNLGRLLLLASRHAEARRHFEAALAAAPELPAALEGMGAVARTQGRHSEAVRWYRELIRHDPGASTAWAALGESLLQVGELDAATEAANKAIAINAADPWPYGLGAQVHTLRGELDAAIALLEAAYRKTGHTALLGSLNQHYRKTCDWQRWADTWAALKPAVLRCEEAGTPFALLCEDLSGAELLAYTRAWAGRRFGALLDAKHSTAVSPPAGRRIRIGYLSSDFQDHPAAYLIAEVLERHDRGQFEVYAYSYGPRDSGAMRQRIITAVEHFVDIAWEPDDRAVELIRNDHIDILVDLKGYTVGDRLNIMAHRPAPVQLTWLGYPGTTGTGFIDHLIADPYILPAGAEPACSEQVVRLPHCYQPTDRRRRIAEPRTRAEYGLPSTATVLCCFNQTFKITPMVFAAWMRILHAVPDAALWLIDDNRWATANLRNAAMTAGIAAERLVFAPRVPLSDHLARYRVADLALDTFPYTSHTTASDALWCGCPLVALCGDTFAARVSASILTAAGLADLITYTLADYEISVITLATTSDKRAGISGRIAEARTRSALFNTDEFTRDLENLYRNLPGMAETLPS